MSVEVLLANSTWYQGLCAQEQQRVKSDLFVKKAQSEAYLCRRGDSADYWMGVINGFVKINNVGLNGKSTTLIGLASGSWFGEGSLLKQETLLYDVVALGKSELALMPKETFFWLLDRSISFNRFLISQLNDRLGQFIGAMENERLLDVESRLARSIATMFKTWSPLKEMILKISQEEVGQLAGLSRQRVNAALKVLEEQQLIKMSFGEIHILNLEGLSKFQPSNSNP
jgi:CRP-like cAMP-binding protein